MPAVFLPSVYVPRGMHVCSSRRVFPFLQDARQSLSFQFPTFLFLRHSDVSHSAATLYAIYTVVTEENAGEAYCQYIPPKASSESDTDADTDIV